MPTNKKVNLMDQPVSDEVLRPDIDLSVAKPDKQNFHSSYQIDGELNYDDYKEAKDRGIDTVGIRNNSQLNDVIAEDQGFGEKVFNDGMRMLGGAASSSIGGFAAIVGAADAAINQKLDNFYTNGMVQWANELDEAANERFKNYYDTNVEKDYQESNILAKINPLGHGGKNFERFWGNEVWANSGFMVGAMVDEAIFSLLEPVTAGTVAPAQVAATSWLGARLANKFKNAFIRTAELGSELSAEGNILANTAGRQALSTTMLDGLKEGRRLITGAGYESAVEAITFKKQAEKTVMENYAKHHNKKVEDITEEEQAMILKDVNEASNGVFLANLGTVGLTNAIGTTALFGISKDLRSRMIPKTVSEFFGRKNVIGEAGKRTANLMSNPEIFGRALKSAASEGVEEFAQGIYQDVGQRYLEDKHNPNVGSSLAHTIGLSASELAERLGDPAHEGWSEFATGFFSAALGLPNVKKFRNPNTKTGFGWNKEENLITGGLIGDIRDLKQENKDNIELANANNAVDNSMDRSNSVVSDLVKQHLDEHLTSATVTGESLRASIPITAGQARLANSIKDKDVNDAKLDILFHAAQARNNIGQLADFHNDLNNEFEDHKKLATQTDIGLNDNQKADLEAKRNNLKNAYGENDTTKLLEKIKEKQERVNQKMNDIKRGFEQADNMGLEGSMKDMMAYTLSIGNDRISRANSLYKDLTKQFNLTTPFQDLTPSEMYNLLDEHKISSSKMKEYFTGIEESKKALEDQKSVEATDENKSTQEAYTKRHTERVADFESKLDAEQKSLEKKLGKSLSSVDFSKPENTFTALNKAVESIKDDSLSYNEAKQKVNDLQQLVAEHKNSVKLYNDIMQRPYLYKSKEKSIKENGRDIYPDDKDQEDLTQVAESKPLEEVAKPAEKKVEAKKPESKKIERTESVSDIEEDGGEELEVTANNQVAIDKLKSATTFEFLNKIIDIVRSIKGLSQAEKDACEAIYRTMYDKLYKQFKAMAYEGNMVKSKLYLKDYNKSILADVTKEAQRLIDLGDSKGDILMTEVIATQEAFNQSGMKNMPNIIRKILTPELKFSVEKGKIYDYLKAKGLNIPSKFGQQSTQGYRVVRISSDELGFDKTTNSPDLATNGKTGETFGNPYVSNVAGQSYTVLALIGTDSEGEYFAGILNDPTNAQYQVSEKEFIPYFKNGKVNFELTPTMLGEMSFEDFEKQANILLDAISGKIDQLDVDNVHRFTTDEKVQLSDKKYLNSLGQELFIVQTYIPFENNPDGNRSVYQVLRWNARNESWDISQRQFNIDQLPFSNNFFVGDNKAVSVDVSKQNETEMVKRLFKNLKKDKESGDIFFTINAGDQSNVLVTIAYDPEFKAPDGTIYPAKYQFKIDGETKQWVGITEQGLKDIQKSGDITVLYQTLEQNGIMKKMDVPKIKGISFNLGKANFVKEIEQGKYSIPRFNETSQKITGGHLSEKVTEVEELSKTESEFDIFVKTGKVSNETIDKMVQKQLSNEPFTDEEVSYLSEKGIVKQFESKLKSIKESQKSLFEQVQEDLSRVNQGVVPNMYNGVTIMLVNAFRKIYGLKPYSFNNGFNGEDIKKALDETGQDTLNIRGMLDDPQTTKAYLLKLAKEKDSEKSNNVQPATETIKPESKTEISLESIQSENFNDLTYNQLKERYDFVQNSDALKVTKNKLAKKLEDKANKVYNRSLKDVKTQLSQKQSEISHEQAVNEFKEYFPDSALSTEDVSTVLGRLSFMPDTVVYGVYDGLVRLRNAGVAESTALFEGFRLVFNSLIKSSERDVLYQEAFNKYFKGKSKNEIKEIVSQFQQDYVAKDDNGFVMTNFNDLTHYYLETMMARDFIKFKESGQFETEAKKSFIRKVFDKILSMLGFRSNTKNLFAKIARKEFANVDYKADQQGIKTMLEVVRFINVNSEDRTDLKKIRDLLTSGESDKIMNRVMHYMFNDTVEPEKAFNSAFEKTREYYSIDNFAEALERVSDVKSAKVFNTLHTFRTALGAELNITVLNDEGKKEDVEITYTTDQLSQPISSNDSEELQIAKVNYKTLKKESVARMKDLGLNISEEEEDEELTQHRALRGDYATSAREIGGELAASKKLKEYISSIMYSTDEFELGLSDDELDSGKFNVPVNFMNVYPYLLRLTVNKRKSEMLPIIKAASEFSDELNAFYQKLMSDCTYQDENGNMQIDMENSLMQLVLANCSKSDLEGISYVTDTANKKEIIVQSNRQNSENTQIERWASNFVDSEADFTEQIGDIRAKYAEIVKILADNEALINDKKKTPKQKEEGIKDYRAKLIKLRNSLNEFGMDFTLNYLDWCVNPNKYQNFTTALGLSPKIGNIFSDNSDTYIFNVIKDRKKFIDKLKSKTSKELEDMKIDSIDDLNVFPVDNIDYVEDGAKQRKESSHTTLKAIATVNGYFDSTQRLSSYMNEAKKRIYGIIPQSLVTNLNRNLNEFGGEFINFQNDWRNGNQDMERGKLIINKMFDLVNLDAENGKEAYEEVSDILEYLVQYMVDNHIENFLPHTITGGVFVSDFQIHYLEALRKQQGMIVKKEYTVDSNKKQEEGLEFTSLSDEDKAKFLLGIWADKGNNKKSKAKYLPLDNANASLQFAYTGVRIDRVFKEGKQDEDLINDTKETLGQMFNQEFNRVDRALQGRFVLNVAKHDKKAKAFFDFGSFFKDAKMSRMIDNVNVSYSKEYQEFVKTFKSKKATDEMKKKAVELYKNNPRLKEEIEESLFNYHFDKAEKFADSLKPFYDTMPQTLVPETFSPGNADYEGRMKDSIMEFYFDSMINNYYMYQFLVGDKALTLKNTIDLFKRGKANNAMGNSQEGRRNLKIATLESVSHTIGENELPADKEFYANSVTHKNLTKEIDRTDAETKMSVDGLTEFLKANGLYIPKVAQLYDYVKYGVEITVEQSEFLRSNKAEMQKRKMIYAGVLDFIKTSCETMTYQSCSIWDDKNKELLDAGFFDMTQTEQFMFAKTLTKDISTYRKYIPSRKAAFDQLVFMEENKLDLLVYDSAQKKMQRKVHKDIADAKSKGEKAFHYLDPINWREQLSTDGVKDEITDPTQKKSLIWSEQDLNATVDINGKKVKLGVVKDNFKNLVAQRVNMLKEQSDKKLLIDGEVNEQVLREAFTDSLIASGNTTQTIQMYQNNNLNYAHIVEKAESMFYAYFKKILANKVPGTAVALCSDSNYQVMRALQDIQMPEGKVIKAGEVITSTTWEMAKDKFVEDEHFGISRLRYGVPKGDGTFYGECILPENHPALQYLEYGMIPQEFAYMVGTRIPTDDKHSMMQMKVVDTLPAYMGATGVFPLEIIALSGADFDIDKEYLDFFGIYENEDGKWIKYGDYKTIHEAFKEWSKDNPNRDFFAFQKSKQFKNYEQRVKYNQGEDVEKIANTLDELNNDALEAQMLLVHNEANNDVATNPTSFKFVETAIAAKSLIFNKQEIIDFNELEMTIQEFTELPIAQKAKYAEDYVAGKGYVNTATSYCPDDILESLRNTCGGGENIGVFALANTMIQTLNEVGLLPHISIVKGKMLLDGKDLRINEILYTLVASSTDNGKEQHAAVLNLTPETAGLFVDLVARQGLHPMIAFTLIDDKVADIFRSDDTSEKDSEKRLANLKSELLHFYPELESMKQTDMLVDILSDPDPLNKTRTDLLNEAQEGSMYSMHITRVLSLNKGLPITIADNFARMKDIEAIEKGIVTKSGNRIDPPFEGRKIFEIPYLKAYKEVIESVNSKITNQVFISANRTFQKAMNILNKTYPKTERGAINKDMNKQFISYLVTKLLFENNKMIQGLSNIEGKPIFMTPVINKIKNQLLASKEFRNNILLKSMVSKKRTIKDDSIFNNQTMVYQETNTFAKQIKSLDEKAKTEFERFYRRDSIVNDFIGKTEAEILDSLKNYSDDQLAGTFIDLLYATSVLKDSMQFKAGSVAKYFISDQFTESDELMNNLIKQFGNENFMQKTLGKSFEELLDQFTYLYSLNTNNKDSIVTSKTKALNTSTGVLDISKLTVKDRAFNYFITGRGKDEETTHFYVPMTIRVFGDDGKVSYFALDPKNPDNKPFLPSTQLGLVEQYAATQGLAHYVKVKQTGDKKFFPYWTDKFELVPLPPKPATRIVDRINQIKEGKRVMIMSELDPADGFFDVYENSVDKTNNSGAYKIMVEPVDVKFLDSKVFLNDKEFTLGQFAEYLGTNEESLKKIWTILTDPKQKFYKIKSKAKDVAVKADVITRTEPVVKVKTESGNVVIKPWSELKDAKEAITSKGIISTRISNSDQHFGNPYSSDEKVLKQNPTLIKTNSTKESVEKYKDWVINSQDQRAKWIREQLKSGKLKGLPIFYYKELGEASHANALDYLINQYNWGNKVEPIVTPQYEYDTEEPQYDEIDYEKGYINEDGDWDQPWDEPEASYYSVIKDGVGFDIIRDDNTNKFMIVVNKTSVLNYGEQVQFASLKQALFLINHPSIIQLYKQQFDLADPMEFQKTNSELADIARNVIKTIDPVRVGFNNGSYTEQEFEDWNEKCN